MLSTVLIAYAHLYRALGGLQKTVPDSLYRSFDDALFLIVIIARNEKHFSYAFDSYDFFLNSETLFRPPGICVLCMLYRLVERKRHVLRVFKGH